MSRARTESHVHVVAADPARAAHRLAREWQDERRQTWTIQPERPGTPLVDLYARRRDLYRSIPPDRAGELNHARAARGQLSGDLDDLYNGRRRWAEHPAGQAVHAGRQAITDRNQANARLADPRLGWWGRRQANRQLAAATDRYHQAAQQWQQHGQPIETRYRQRLEHVGARLTELDQAQQHREAFLAAHPDIDRGLGL